MSAYHLPVLLKAVLDAAQGARRVVDGTLGDGGHAEAFRAAGAEILAIDRDPDAIRTARARLGEAGIRYLEAPFASDGAVAANADYRAELMFPDPRVSPRPPHP